MTHALPSAHYGPVCPSASEEALAWARVVMTRLGLTLNEAKTLIRDARTERFAL